ncbi:MAG TPA: hypothetical protein DEV81_16860 [Cyanobacteria bacterium UBA11049]|nr:hypothetical protein [Cyanobacteria bacterium UBA11049]
MNNLTTDLYTFEVRPGTRNHKGSFVQETAYKLIGIDQAGWALICLDDVSCHYVDPDDLRDVLS